MSGQSQEMFSDSNVTVASFPPAAASSDGDAVPPVMPALVPVYPEAGAQPAHPASTAPPR